MCVCVYFGARRALHGSLGWAGLAALLSLELPPALCPRSGSSDGLIRLVLKQLSSAPQFTFCHISVMYTSISFPVHGKACAHRCELSAYVHAYSLLLCYRGNWVAGVDCV